MANAIKRISVARGYDVTQYTLQCFGGAGGQHACLVADALGMRSVYLHPLAGVLSAFGMGLADQLALRERALERRLDAAGLAEAREAAIGLAGQAAEELRGQGVAEAAISVLHRVQLRYEGTDTALPCALPMDTPAAEAIAAMRDQFEPVSYTHLTLPTILLV